MEACASLDKLRALLPPGIDPANQPTLLYIAANLAVAAVSNLNDDCITLDDALRTYRGFEWQFVDVEHNRAELRGFIVKAGLSELGTDRLITEAEARAAGKPVNIAVVIALWKVVDADLCAFIERMDAPASPDKGKLSLSFEVGFDDYDIVVLPAGASNLALATQVVTPDNADWSRYDRLLRVNGGRGVLGKDSRVARIIMGNIVPLGAGIVTIPAAAVKGLTTITESPHGADATAAARVDVADAGLYKYSSTQVTLSETDAEPFLAYARAIPDECIYTDPEDETLGREGTPHVTICYGLTTADPTQVQACLAGVPPVSLTFGEVSVFINEDKPYDVLVVSVKSEDLHRLNSLIKTATEVKSSYPTYTPHCTIAYLRKGMARGYVGDTRFKGRGLTVPSISFSPHTGDRIEIPLHMADGTQTDATQVYIPAEAMPKTVQIAAEFTGLQESIERQVRDGLATASALSRQIKLSEGWQTRLAALQAAAGKDPLVNGVNITLSDGRTFSNVHVFDGQTLELDKELSMSGVIITDMTPGARAQADDQANETPSKAVVYPTRSAEQQARDAANEAQRRAGQNAAYTDAALTVIATETKTAFADVATAATAFSKQGLNTQETLKRTRDAMLLTRLAGVDLAKSCEALASAINGFTPSVSSSNPTSPSMNLSELKQSLAAVKTVEELPTAVANVAAFADAIAKASEQMANERKTAQDAATAAQASVEQVKADLATLTTKHNEMVAAQQAAAAETQFNDHMTAVEATFDLDDEVRAEIVDEVKAASTDEAFAKWLTSAKKKMKGFMKKGDKGKEPDADDAKAALAAKEAAKVALASAAAAIVDAPVSHDFQAAQSLKAQYEATFAAGINVGGVKVKDLTAKK